MAETPQTPWRAAWVRAVARRMKAWAEAVLADEAGLSSTAMSGKAARLGTLLEEEPGPAPAGALPLESPKPAPAGPRGAAPGAGTPASSPLSPLAPGTTLEDVEARWLRDIEARRSVPVSDWVARVNRGVPRAMEELVRAGLVPPPAPSHGSGAADGMPRMPAPPAWAVPDAPRPVTRPRSPVRSEPERAEPDAHPVLPPPLESSSFVRSPPSPAPSSRAQTPRLEPEAARGGPFSSWSQGPETLPPFPFPAPPARPPAGAEPWSPPAPTPRVPPLPEPAAPVRRSPWDDFPPFASEERVARTPTLVPSPAPPLPDAEPPAPEERVRTLPAPSLQRNHPYRLEQDSVPRFEPREPPRNRAFIPADEGPWDGAHSPLLWRPRLVEAPRPTQPVPSGPHEEPEAGFSSPWPELPPAPAPESTETVVELRQWERLRRLEREQRGE